MYLQSVQEMQITAKIAILFLAVAFSKNAAGQPGISPNILTGIIQTFSESYPTVQVKHWKMDSGNYAAGFLIKKEEHSQFIHQMASG